VSFALRAPRSSLRTSFNDDHIAPPPRRSATIGRAGTDGPLFLARTLISVGAGVVTALEVLAANDVTVLVDSRDGFTPTPALSHAVLAHNAPQCAKAESLMDRRHSVPQSAI